MFRGFHARTIANDKYKKRTTALFERGRARQTSARPYRVRFSSEFHTSFDEHVVFFLLFSLCFLFSIHRGTALFIHVLRNTIFHVVSFVADITRGVVKRRNGVRTGVVHVLVWNACYTRAHDQQRNRIQLGFSVRAKGISCLENVVITYE